MRKTWQPGISHQECPLRRTGKLGIKLERRALSGRRLLLFSANGNGDGNPENGAIGVGQDQTSKVSETLEVFGTVKDAKLAKNSERGERCPDNNTGLQEITFCYARL